MSIPGQVISFAGTTMASLSVTGGLFPESAAPESDPTYLDRAGGVSTYSTTFIRNGELVVAFKSTTWAGVNSLLKLLDYAGGAGEQALQIYVGDPAAPIAGTVNVTVIGFAIEPSGVMARFRVADPTWDKTSPTVVGPTSFSAAGSMALTNSGQSRVRPIYKIGWSVQRSSPTTVVGYRYRKQFTVTNNGTRTMKNYPIQIGPIDTATLVTAGKMRSTGADLQVFGNGAKLDRYVLGSNSAATFVWFTVDAIAPGAAKTYDLVYGNSAIANNGYSDFGYTNQNTPAIDFNGDDGTATAGAGSTLTDSAKSGVWNTSRFDGGNIYIHAGTGSGQYRRVLTSSAAGVVTVTRAWATNPDATSKYTIWNSGMKVDGGKASGAGTTTTITDSSQAWIVNEWTGATITNVTKSLTGVVASNTATVITISGTWTAPVLNDVYTLTMPNGLWLYSPDQTSRSGVYARGGWHVNRGSSKPSIITFDAPASWYRMTYLKNNDDYAQYRITSTDVGGPIHYFPILNVHRQAGGGGGYIEEGQSDSVALMNPFGFLATRFDFLFLSPSATGTGTCKAVFGCRESGGEDWETYYTYNTTQASLTAIATQSIDLTAYGTPIHVVHTLQPADDVEIPSTIAHKSILQWNTALEMTVDTRNLVVSAFGAEQDVYQMTLTLRLDGTATPTPPYDTIVIGGTGTADTHNVFFPSTQKLWIDAEKGTVQLYTGSVFTADAQYAAKFFRHDYERTGATDTAYEASDVMPVTPGSHTLYVSDAAGNLGTVNVEVDYVEALYS